MDHNTGPRKFELSAFRSCQSRECRFVLARMRELVLAPPECVVDRPVPAQSVLIIAGLVAPNPADQIFQVRILFPGGAELLGLPRPRAAVLDADFDPWVEKDQRLAFGQERLDDVSVAAFQYPAVMRIDKAPHIGDAVLQRAPVSAACKRQLIKRQLCGRVSREDFSRQRAFPRAGVSKDEDFHAVPAGLQRLSRRRDVVVGRDRYIEFFRAQEIHK